MFSRNLKYGMGYTGKMGNKCWVARITGTDTKYRLARQFVDPDEVEREHPGRSRTLVNFLWNLDVGLYECSEYGERWFFIIWVDDGGKYTPFRPTAERVNAMAALMDGGMSAEEARIATRKSNQPTVTAGV